MRLREGQFGEFWSCKGFPQCRGTVDARRAAGAVKPRSYDPDATAPPRPRGEIGLGSRNVILAKAHELVELLQGDPVGAIAEELEEGLHERWSGRWRPGGR